jgi:hypothetical protein
MTIQTPSAPIKSQKNNPFTGTPRWVWASARQAKSIPLGHPDNRIAVANARTASHAISLFM